MHFNMKKSKFRRMSIISNSFDVRTSQRVRNKSTTSSSSDDEKKRDKQLLTPNIKRFLKTWLLEHKDYPYPDRYEKIMLAQETGLTIMQICNWFANWRRKLKLYSKNFKRRSFKATTSEKHSDEDDDDDEEEEIDSDHNDITNDYNPYWKQHNNPNNINNSNTNTNKKTYNIEDAQLHYILNKKQTNNNQDWNNYINKIKTIYNNKEINNESISNTIYNNEYLHNIKQNNNNYKYSKNKIKLWRPHEEQDEHQREDDCKDEEINENYYIKNKDIMLLKWLKSISTFNTLKQHHHQQQNENVIHNPFESHMKSIHYNEDINLNKHNAQYNVTHIDINRIKSPSLSLPCSTLPSLCNDVHINGIRETDEIMAAQVLASFAQKRIKMK